MEILLEEGLEYFSIHEKTDYYNNHNLQDQGRESGLNDFIEYYKVNFEFDRLFLVGYKLVINKYDQILNIPHDTSYLQTLSCRYTT